MYPNIVSLAGFDEDGYYQNDEADILLNESTGWFCAALIRVNIAASSGATHRMVFSSLDSGTFQGVELYIGTTADNVLEIAFAMGTGLAIVTRTQALHPATTVGKILMPWMLWNGTTFSVGFNGEQFDTVAAATFANNTDEGMFLGRSAVGGTSDLENFAELTALGFFNAHIDDDQAAAVAAGLYASCERLNDLTPDGALAPPSLPNTLFDYLISMQRQGHSGLNATIANLGTAGGGDFVLHATGDSALELRTSPTHWACPTFIED